MHPTNFKQAYDKPLGAGDNPNTGDLPFRVARDPRTPGVVMLVSCWELSPRELEEVKKTGKVFVAVMAHEEYRTQPPISVHGCNPFEYLPGAAYIPVPRTFAEEQVDGIVAKTNEKILRNQDGDIIGPTDEVPSQDPRVVAKVREIVSEGGNPFADLDLAVMGASTQEIRAVLEKILNEKPDRSGLLEASGIFPESNGIAPALEVREDPRARTFTEEVTGKKLAN